MLISIRSILTSDLIDAVAFADILPPDVLADAADDGDNVDCMIGNCEKSKLRIG